MTPKLDAVRSELPPIFGCKRTQEDCNYRMCSNYFNCMKISEALSTAERSGFERGIEAAAKIAENVLKSDFSDSSKETSAFILTHIRNLAEKETK